mmetsp:Transcript_21811/g.66213  ORF Transcript_21811/g.66213 Transcript_21811/m.66213 type:complete len:112 (-) Transcript_21811:1428-1763(-)
MVRNRGRKTYEAVSQLVGRKRLAAQLVLQRKVIKIEPLGGDPIRTWRELDVDGTSPWFRSVGRNKRSVALNLKSERARELVRQLAVDSDVLIENFKPGTMEKWRLGLHGPC